jgi:hypothetical protein
MRNVGEAPRSADDCRSLWESLRQSFARETFLNKRLHKADARAQINFEFNRDPLHNDPPHSLTHWSHLGTRRDEP